MIIYNTKDIRITNKEREELKLIQEAIYIGANILRYNGQNFELWQYFDDNKKEGYLGKVQGATNVFLKAVCVEELKKNKTVFNIQEVINKFVTSKDLKSNILKPRDAINVITDNAMANNTKGVYISPNMKEIYLYTSSDTRVYISSEDKKILCNAFKEKLPSTVPIGISMDNEMAITYLTSKKMT